MKCHESRRFLDLFMDNELSVPENLKVLEHLNLCAGCGGVYEGEKALRELLRERLGRETAPPGLVGRLSAALHRPRGIRLRVWPRAVAAAFFLALLAGLLFTPVAELPAALASEASSRHEATRAGYCGSGDPAALCVCGKCCDDAEKALDEFFLRRVGAAACFHELEGYEYVGGSIWEHRGAPVSWTIQRDSAGHTISHALVTTPVAGPAVDRMNAEGRTVLIVRTNAPGLTCVLVFDREEDAERFLNAAPPPRK